MTDTVAELVTPLLEPYVHFVCWLKQNEPKKRAWDRINRAPFIPTRAGRIYERTRLNSIYVLLDAHKLNASIKGTLRTNPIRSPSKLSVHAKRRNDKRINDSDDLMLKKLSTVLMAADLSI